MTKDDKRVTKTISFYFEEECESERNQLHNSVPKAPFQYLHLCSFLMFSSESQMFLVENTQEWTVKNISKRALSGTLAIGYIFNICTSPYGTS